MSLTIPVPTFDAFDPVRHRSPGLSPSLVAISPTGGNGYLYEIAPGGRLNMNSYYFYQYNQMNFYEDTIG
jgi:hypothetical protein